jgi:hypothetical protein
MPDKRLIPLQERVLDVLAGMEPRWTLFGAGALIVEVLEVSGDIAVARASSSEYLEYLSLAKCNGQWAIVNILWRFQTTGARGGASPGRE